jgi:hypothetical protein
MAFIIRRAARPVPRTIFCKYNARTASRNSFSSIMANQSIPVVLIGRTGEVGSVVADVLKPEYEGQPRS